MAIPPLHSAIPVAPCAAAPDGEKDLFSLASDQELFRRLPKGELHEALDNLATLDLTRTEELVPLMQQPDFTHTFFREERWAEYVLHGSVTGKLTAYETAKLFLYKAVQEYTLETSPQVVQLLDAKGEVDREAWELLCSGMKGQYSERELDALLENLQRHPPEETQFFTVTRKRSKMIGALKFFGHTLFANWGTNSVQQLVMPPALAEAIYHSKWEDQTMRSRPVFGLSASTDFEDPNFRDILIPASLFTMPKQADGIGVDPLEFYHHDSAYHLWLESTNPHRELWIQMAKKLSTMGEEIVANKCRDRELHYTHYEGSDAYKFEHFFHQTIQDGTIKGPLISLIKAYDRSLVGASMLWFLEDI
ncbi:MAG: hypothetical protein K940chlam2_01406 [Chlamydiae bacterium]|nr:hypothetical protein [Chlamydiota bacterium]